MSLVAVALVGAACAWLAGGRRRRLTAGHDDERVEVDGSRVSVVIPVRNEEAALPTLLASLVLSDVRPADVVVVDDGSTDATASVARSAGVRVVDPGEPPTGWTGKTWACHRGAEAANGDLLLFLDADVCLAPGAVGAFVAAHARTGGLVSVQPHHTVERPVEELSALFNAVAVLGAGACSPVSRWRGRAVVAYGPCMLTSRDDYERAGGHAAVRSSVAEDLVLAGRYRDAGMPTTAWTGGTMVTFRMYPDGLGQLVEGWTKNMATGATVASRPAVLLTTAWIASLAAVVAGAVSAVVSCAGGGDVPWSAAGAYVIAAASVRWATVRVGRFSPWTAAAFPVPLAAFVGVFARSAWRLVRGAPVRWRGRDVPLRSSVEGGEVGADGADRPLR